jgi:predicted NBD/HSP70 family sugar kinase
MYRQPTITRGEILKATGLNPASLSHCLQNLIAAGVVLRVGEIESRTGRPPDLLRLNPDAAYFVVVDLEASPIRFAVTNLLGDIRYRWEEGDPADAMDVALIAKGVEMVCGPMSRRELDAILAISICRPGIADAEGRVTSVNMGWRQFPFEKKVAAAFDRPVFVENGGRAYVLAEYWLGRARGIDHCVYVEVGKGVGGAIISHGTFFQGRKQAEFGHITIEPDAPDLCKCGKRGCLEAIASSGSIVRQYLEMVRGSQRLPGGINASEVIDRAQRDDPQALAVINRAMRALGLGLSYLMAIFDPELFVLGGYFVGAEDFLLPRLQAELAKYVREWNGPYELAVSRLGLDIGLKGAAALAFHRTLADETLLRTLCQKRVWKSETRKKAG